MSHASQVYEYDEQGVRWSVVNPDDACGVAVLRRGNRLRIVHRNRRQTAQEDGFEENGGTDAEDQLLPETDASTIQPSNIFLNTVDREQHNPPVDNGTEQLQAPSTAAYVPTHLTAPSIQSPYSAGGFHQDITSLKALISDVLKNARNLQQDLTERAEHQRRILTWFSPPVIYTSEPPRLSLLLQPAEPALLQPLGAPPRPLSHHTLRAAPPQIPLSLQPGPHQSFPPPAIHPPLHLPADHEHWDFCPLPTLMPNTGHRGAPNPRPDLHHSHLASLPWSTQQRLPYLDPPPVERGRLRIPVEEAEDDETPRFPEGWFRDDDF
ncbi:uncharacterized protein EI97DRAFT_454035 [Westerdykella ornata]|uniref:Uncharacterized protein n=1 Tax=Westerdykella ornata TaxID=318751 RepID=A0A6A6JVZ9_WESOR|nr:uncharacterized protein EI97DRAFT_454035 [Westerdykella ornata]KAF2280790.1 hypothetical protein EI97DRAFT_454035 [Westerdykella ornata]